MVRDLNNETAKGVCKRAYVRITPLPPTHTGKAETRTAEDEKHEIHEEQEKHLLRLSTWEAMC